jgi:hypothetical protein
MSLFLNEPVIAVAVTLAAFLAMAGLAGGASSRLSSRGGTPLKSAAVAALLAAACIGVYALVPPTVLNGLTASSLLIRMGSTLLIITPLAMVMGFPFPLAIAALKEKQAGAVPWAWGLNGCGSLIGPVLGIAIAIYGGVTAVLLAAALCYGMTFAAISINENVR